MNKIETFKKVDIDVYGKKETLIASPAMLNHLAVVLGDASRGQFALGYTAISDTYDDMAHQIYEALKEDGFYDN